MNEKIILWSIVALTVLIVLFMFRRQLKHFLFKAGSEGIEARLDTYEKESNRRESDQIQTPGTINISRNRQVGKNNKIEVAQENVNVTENKQLGSNQEIKVKRTSQRKKRR